MERKKLCASLIAVAMGFAFSVGGAAAYEQGDLANVQWEGKLIPYYMAGENMFTAIGINNQNNVPADAIHIFEVRSFSTRGAHQGTAQLCLAANQFGYALLQQETMDDGGTRVGLKTGVGDKTFTSYGIRTGTTARAGSTRNTAGEGSGIATEGFVIVQDMGHFTTGGTADDGDNTNDGCSSTGTIITAGAGYGFATWAILQDVGMDSAFGTEILSATVLTDDTPGEDAGLNCTAPANCPGLVVTASQMATVRFDMSMANDSQSMIYVWLASATGFAGSTGARGERMVDVTVHCEGATRSAEKKINLPDYVNVIDAMDLECDARGVAMIDLDGVATATPATAQSNIAKVWSHISQEGGGYRMNMPGYYTVP